MLIMIKTDKLSSEDKWQAESHHITPGSHCNGLRRHLSVHGHWSGGQGWSSGHGVCPMSMYSTYVCRYRYYYTKCQAEIETPATLHKFLVWGSAYVLYPNPMYIVQTEKYFQLYKTLSVVQIKSIMQNIQPWGLRWGWSRVTMRWWVSNYAGHQSSAAAELCSR